MKTLSSDGRIEPVRVVARRLELPHQEGDVNMQTAPILSLPRPGQKARWRNPEQARACGWEDVFGHGPYTVVGTVDHSDHGLAAGLILQTELRKQEISKVWLSLADESENVTGSC